jgi:hypothetical protein
MTPIITKVFEVRDRNTFIPVIASAMQSDDFAQSYLLRRSGYAHGGTVLVARLQGGGASNCDVYDWRDRTMQNAHAYIEKEFSNLKDGDVIDVEFILGETSSPKCSERMEGVL